MGLREILGRDAKSFPWERALLVALALQARSLLLLLGVWLSLSAGGFPPFLSRLRMMPAHPDWYLAALIQNLTIGLVLVWIGRRLAGGWALTFAAIAGSMAWLGASTYLASSPLDGYLQVVRPVQEFIDIALLLGTLASLRPLLRSSWGTLLVSTVAATLCGVVRLMLTYSVWGAPWIDTWRFDLAIEALSGVVFATALLLLATISAQGRATPRPSSIGLYLGTHGLAVCSLAYLQLALRFTGWQPTDAPALLWGVGALTACGYAVLFSAVRAMWRATQDRSAEETRSAGIYSLTLSGPGIRLCALYAALELCAVPFAVFSLGRWHWALASIGVLGLILLRVLGTLVVAKASATSARLATAHEAGAT